MARRWWAVVSRYGTITMGFDGGRAMIYFLKANAQAVAKARGCDESVREVTIRVLPKKRGKK